MFRTEIPLTPAPQQLARTARVLTLGSCFADSIGGRLAAHKVTTLVNPFGTVFNPLSLTLLLRAAAGEAVDWTQHLLEARGRWQSYDLHGSIGAESADALLARIQELVRDTAEFVPTADVLALTLGTAWAYRLRETGELVSNCHKMPADLFEKELLAVEDIVGSLAETHALLRRLNPRLRLVLTVSPVRHLRDTLPLNSVSKGVLRLASHYLSELLPDVSYFPAYELLTDDLRDYRFYAADMLHPSAVAEDYIWERFARTYFDAEFGRFRKEWDGIQQALAHRPLHAGAPEHRQFLENTLAKLRGLASRQVEVQAEIEEVEQRLAALPTPKLQPATAPEPADDGEERIDSGLPEATAVVAAPEPQSPQRAPRAEALPPERGPGPAAPAEAAPASAEQAAEELRTGRNRGRGRSKQRQPPQEKSPVLAAVQAVGPDQAPAAVATVAAPVAKPSRAPAKASYTDFLISSAPELSRISPPSSPPPMAAPMALEQQAREEHPKTVATEVPAAETLADEPVKNKKRRSRGGAKRTARKNAARLAAEQAVALPTATANNPTDAPPEAAAAREIAEGLATDTAATPAAPFLPVDTSAQAQPADSTGPNSELELEQSAAPAEPAATTSPAAGDRLKVNKQADPAAPAVERVGAADPSTAAGPKPAPAAPRGKRGPGPVAKKSTVIAKSTPVKRGGRRGAAPATTGPAAVSPAFEEPAAVPPLPSLVDAPDLLAAETPSPATASPTLPVVAEQPAQPTRQPTKSKRMATPKTSASKPKAKAAGPQAAETVTRAASAPPPARAAGTRPRKPGANPTPAKVESPAAASAVAAPAAPRRLQAPRPKKDSSNEAAA